ncbi:eIF4-gamma/eIF5/eIF2-epsilon-domain-containing protein [Gaertneriomyces semiglobifer]|nr:eIF4-gamma/eIF5/eIF2-epsilon-domain-containing protein [Gaertneriomyces semiglobifer]
MESAVGIILYRARGRNIELLLVHDSLSNKRHWTPPKAKLIGNEDELKCAIRAGADIGLSVKDVLIDEGFRAEIRYLSGTKPKRMVFHLGHLAANARVVPQGYGLNMNWLPLKQAMEKVMYKSMQDVLQKAIVFVESLQARQATTDAATLPHHMQKMHLNNSRSGSSGRLGDGMPYRRSFDAPPGSPGRQRNGDNRGMFLGPNGSKNWKEPNENVSNQLSEAEQLRPAPLQRPQPDHSSNPLYKTRLCERFETEGHCPYGSRCTFAHGQVELRDRPAGQEDVPDTRKDGPTSPLYKTRLCERFMKDGFCQYGPRCNFAHSESELRERPQAPSRDPSAPLEREQWHSERFGSSSEHPPERQPLFRKVTIGSDHGQEKPVIEKPIPVKPPVAPSTPPPVRSQKNEKASLKDLMSRDDRDKPWMRVVELTEDQKRVSSPRPTITSADEKTLIEDRLAEDLRKLIESGTRTVNDEVKEVTRIEFKHDLSKPQVFRIIFGALFVEEFDHQKLIDRVALFQQDQLTFLKSWEKFLIRKRNLMSKTAMILKSLYDSDLVEEDVFLRWYDDVQDADLKKKSTPFATWLRTAEEEED